MSDVWFALMIGNSRYHWARFVGEKLTDSWHESYQQQFEGRFLDLLREGGQGVDGRPPIWAASVVPAQAQRWEPSPYLRWITLADVPLPGLYPTLGIDRALALWGAIAHVGSPVLVIDAGTALTFTGADATQTLVGGAILPGVRLQFEALGQQTAIFANPANFRQTSPSTSYTLPPPPTSRWALDTESAIASGILYTLTAGLGAFIQSWRQQFSESRLVMTGGDGHSLYCWLQQEYPDLANLITVDESLIFRGIQAVRGANNWLL